MYHLTQIVARCNYNMPLNSTKLHNIEEDKAP